MEHTRQGLADFRGRDGFGQDRRIDRGVGDCKRISGNYDERDVLRRQHLEDWHAASVGKMVVDDGRIDVVRDEIGERTLVARRERLERANTFQLEPVVDGDYRVILDNEDPLTPEREDVLTALSRMQTVYQHTRALW